MVGGVALDGGPAVTTAVASETAVTGPRSSVMVTDRRIVCPTSPVATPYVGFVAPAIATQLVPLASQRCHVRTITSVPAYCQPPSSAVSVSPSRARPEIAGRRVAPLIGAVTAE